MFLLHLFTDDGDSGSGEASGDDASGSGEDSELATISDLWQFVSFTTHNPPALPRSGVTQQRSMFFSVSVVIICLAVIPVVCPVLYC